MKKLFFFGSLALMLFTACSSDVPDSPESYDSTEWLSSCVTDFDELFSTEEVTLVEGPIDCEDDNGLLCGVFKARIESPNTPNHPVENVSLDEQAYPIEVLLVVRSLSEETLCMNRWIVFDAGGYGMGYASSFGDVLPGAIEERGEGYGDDLILEYTKLGYTTVDLVYQYPSLTKNTADPDGLAAWVKTYKKGTAWFRNLNEASFLGSASRSRAVYDWAYQNSRDRTVCAHAHSSGSGRLIGALTRLGAENLFDTIVFDGGPVSAYMPWICLIDDGPLGPRPEEYFNLNAKTANSPATVSISCAHTKGNNENSCNYNYCLLGEMDDAMLEDSFFVSATDRDFPEIDISIALGGKDDSPAFKNVLLWLGGYTATNGDEIPPISAKSITLKQGYCKTASGTFLDGFLCGLWGLDKFPTISNLDIYNEALLYSEHDTTKNKDGMNTVKSLMLQTCEL